MVAKTGRQPLVARPSGGEPNYPTGPGAAVLAAFLQRLLDEANRIVAERKAAEADK